MIGGSTILEFWFSEPTRQRVCLLSSVTLNTLLIRYPKPITNSHSGFAFIRNTTPLSSSSYRALELFIQIKIVTLFLSVYLAFPSPFSPYITPFLRVPSASKNVDLHVHPFDLPINVCSSSCSSKETQTFDCSFIYNVCSWQLNHVFLFSLTSYCIFALSFHLLYIFSLTYFLMCAPHITTT